MPPAKDRYVSLDDLKAELPFDRSAFDDSETEWENRLERLLDEESYRIEGESFTGTVFDTRTNTATFRDGDRVYGDGKDLVLPDIPIQSVASIDADGDTITPGTDAIVRDSHIRLLVSEAPINRWPDGIDEPITVEWTYGVDNVPPEVKNGVIRLVRSRLEQIKSDGIANESSPAGQSISYRKPAKVRAEVASGVAEHRPDGYLNGAQVI